MSVTANVSAVAAVSADPPRERSHTWIAIVILLGILAGMMAASFYVDPPVLDGSLVGP
jgi:hypothetical protein